MQLDSSVKVISKNTIMIKGNLVNTKKPLSGKPVEMFANSVQKIGLPRHLPCNGGGNAKKPIKIRRSFLKELSETKRFLNK